MRTIKLLRKPKVPIKPRHTATTRCPVALKVCSEEVPSKWHALPDLVQLRLTLDTIMLIGFRPCIGAPCVPGKINENANCNYQTLQDVLFSEHRRIGNPTSLTKCRDIFKKFNPGWKVVSLRTKYTLKNIKVFSGYQVLK